MYTMIDDINILRLIFQPVKYGGLNSLEVNPKLMFRVGPEARLFSGLHLRSPTASTNRPNSHGGKKNLNQANCEMSEEKASEKMPLL